MPHRDQFANVYLFQPNFKTGEGPYSGYWFPYSAGCIWIAAQSDADVRQTYRLRGLGFRRESIGLLVDRMSQPDVVGFSSYIWNWQYNLRLASRVRATFPDALIVFGGPQVPQNDPEFFRRYPFIDVGVVGEGEHAFTDILKKRLIAGSQTADYWQIPGCIAPAPNGDLLRGPAPERLAFGDLPSPYTAGLFDELSGMHREGSWNATIETNRGCPYQCTFCDWGSLTYSKVKQSDISRTLAEVTWCAQHRCGQVYITDANFGLFYDRDRQVADEFIRQRALTGFPDSIALSWAKQSSEAVLDLAADLTRAGLNKAVTLSLQSVTPHVLSEIKRINLKPQKLSSLLDTAERAAIPTYTELILGLPGESLASWKAGLAGLLEQGQHNSVDFWLCELLPNAELASQEQRLRHGLVTRYVDNYFMVNSDEDESVSEGIELVCATRTMSTHEMVEAYLHSWIILHFHLYGWLQLVARFLRRYQLVSYEAFYGGLDSWIRDNSGIVRDELSAIESLISKYLEGHTPDEFPDPYTGLRITPKTALWKAQFAFRSRPDEVKESLQPFIDAMLRGVPKELVGDVRTLQDEFVTLPLRAYPRQITLRSNLWEFIRGEEALLSEPRSYCVNLAGSRAAKDMVEHLLMLYFFRRNGWGKARITPA